MRKLGDKPLDPVLIKIARGASKDTNVDSLRNQISTYIQENGKISIQAIVSSISAEFSRHRVGLAISYARIGILLDAKKFFRAIRRAGVLRASKYNFETGQIKSFSGALLRFEKDLNISYEDEQYLTSIINITPLADELRKIRLDLIKNIKPFSRTILKSCLVSIDRSFWPANEEQEGNYVNSIMGYDISMEDKASGFSCIVAILGKIINYSDMDAGMQNADLIKSGFIDNIINIGYQFSMFMDVETLLDSFPYSAKNENGIIKISANDPLLEKAIRLGYIQTNLQAIVRRSKSLEINNSQIESLKNISLKFIEELGEDFIVLKTGKFKRYVIQIPHLPPLIKILSGNSLFEEEISYLYETALDSFLDISTLMDAVVVKDITVMDLVKVRRLFTFQSIIIFKSLQDYPHLYDRDEVDIFSRIPVFTKSLLASLFSGIFGVKKGEYILKLLSFECTSKKYLDIQYTPILELENYYMFSLGVISNSNIIRNLLCAHSVRLLTALKSDPMQDAVENALLANNISVAKNTERTVDGRKLEIDLLAFCDGNLLIIECKNSFHPCDSHELRTSYGHLETASKQLSRAKSWLSDSNSQKKLFKELKWDADNIKKISTCVLTANRLFSGYSVDKHPVRHAHEFLNILGSGEIQFNDSHYRTRKSDTFQISDLIDYLEGEGLIQFNLDSLVSFNVSCKYENLILLRETYDFDPETANNLLKERFKNISKEEYESNVETRNFAPANIGMLGKVNST